MIQNRELNMDDYLAMFRRRAKMILVPALVAPLAAFAVSWVFPAKWTSQSLVMVEGQKVPETMVQPVVSEDLTARIGTLQQEVLSDTNLRPVVGRLYPGKNTEETAAIIDAIRLNMTVTPVITDLSMVGSGGKPPKPGTSPVPGFYVNYTAPSAHEAQQICNELTTLMVDENLKTIQAAAVGTSDVLSKGIEDAKAHLDDLDTKLAAFKKQYVGQLPGDEENNLKILMGLNTQLEANTQTLNRAQQDKAYIESVLAQQVTAWKTSQSSTNPQTLEKQLSDLQAQLLELQAKYTDDHPDVIKTKADIAEVKKKLAEVNKASSDATDTGTDKASGMEPPEIRQLRLQVHQYGELIAAATREQKRYQQEIDVYQGRISLSPAIEEQYKALTRDYDNGQKSYQDLLAKKASADMTVKMNNQAQGERMVVLIPAQPPDAQSFPVRWIFAVGGLGAGLGLGCLLAGWLEFRDNSIRNEADAEAALELPMLVAVPWVGVPAEENNNGKGKFWKRGGGVKRGKEKEKETVGV